MPSVEVIALALRPMAIHLLSPYARASHVPRPVPVRNVHIDPVPAAAAAVAAEYGVVGYVALDAVDVPAAFVAVALNV